ncbi:MAG TPA: phosphatidylserine/phosphatidylglycerophosphate/cardiolipin synthase family protein [Bacteriovoracaceae bacterium]|nr:phosphatidylserine/phosphatidylglycerophosphate/cardiolipin synthase family protein [Bacteriovoracaceae bacterium]
MKFWLFSLYLILFSSTSWAQIRTYFNYNQESAYTDPRGIYRYGDNLEKVIVDELKSARHSIYVAVQELRLPEIAKTLVEKHRAGVDVRIVIENSYNFDALEQRDALEETGESSYTSLAQLVDINGNGKFETFELETRDAIYMLRKARVPFIDDASDGSAGSGLMHHKFVIIDGKKVIVSTANFTMSCIHGDLRDSNTRGNANSLMVIESNSVARVFTQEFDQLWGRNFGQAKTYRGPQTVSVGGQKITIQFSPTTRRMHWNYTVNGLAAKHLSKAQSQIQAALFVFSDQQLSDVMQRAHGRGVHIGVMIENNFAFRNYSELLDMLGLSLLDPNKCIYEDNNKPWKKPIKEGGIPRLAKGDMLHHKFAVIDQKTTIFGSQNWSDSANYNNDETLIVIQSPEVAVKYSREYQRLRQNAWIGPTPYLLKEISRREAYCAELGQY